MGTHTRTHTHSLNIHCVKEPNQEVLSDPSDPIGRIWTSFLISDQLISTFTCENEILTPSACEWGVDKIIETLLIHFWSDD